MKQNRTPELFFLQKTMFLFLFKSFGGKIHRCRLDNSDDSNENRKERIHKKKTSQVPDE